MLLHSQSAHLIMSVVCKMAWLGFIYFPYPSYAAAGIWTHVSRVARTRDVMKDTLPTELPRYSLIIKITLYYFGENYVIDSESFLLRCNAHYSSACYY